MATYEHCNACGFVRASNPVWLNEAYSSAIAAADTGLVVRNISIANKLASILYWVLRERGEGKYLDAAGGYGMLARLMRDYGFDFYWADKYCDNLMARGFEYAKHPGKCRAATAMEVMEHLIDPLAFVQQLFDETGIEYLIFSTELYEGTRPPSQDWWYYAFATGQHIGFFQRRTLEMLAQHLGLHFASAGDLHLLSKVKINEAYMSWVTGRWAGKVASAWSKRRLKSKTMLDHRQLLEN